MTVLEKIRDFLFVTFCVELEKGVDKKISYSWQRFGKLKRTLERRGVLIIKDLGGNFEIWKIFKSKDKYGLLQADTRQIGWYYDAGQVLHYSDDLNEIIDVKYF